MSGETSTANPGDANWKVEQLVPARISEFRQRQPDEKSPDASTWYECAHNFIVAYSEIDGTAAFSRQEQPDEYVLMLPDRATAGTIVFAGQSHVIAGGSLAFVPGGDSEIIVHGRGRAIRMFTRNAGDLIDLCEGPTANLEPDPNVPELRPWSPADHHTKVRIYPLEGEKSGYGSGKTRIWNCSTFTIMHAPADGARDMTKSSAHSHAGFEQGSLVLDGSFEFHMRWPWVADIREWQDDLHRKIAGPALAVIPSYVLHTTGSLEAGRMIDIWSPPRADFAEKPGWIANEGEYIPIDATLEPVAD